MRTLLLLLLLTFCFAEETEYIIEDEYKVVVICLYEDWNTGLVQLISYEDSMTIKKLENILQRKLNDEDWKFYQLTGKFKMFVSTKTV